MARPKEMDFRIPKTLSFDAQIYEEYEQLKGHGNVSSSLNEYMKQEIEKAKKDEAQSNPIGLPNRSTLDMHISILDYTDSIINAYAEKIDNCVDNGHLYTAKERIQKSIIKRMERRSNENCRSPVVLVNGKPIFRNVK